MDNSATIRGVLAESYANLAMAHKAVADGDTKYGRVHFMIRARLRKGLMTNTLSMKSLFDDERLKLTRERACTYCGATTKLSADHLIASSRGGADSGDNLVWACRSCNSSKGARDLLEWWFATRDGFPPLMLLRRYLKLAWALAYAEGVLDESLDSADSLPIRFELIPLNFPKPSELVLWADDTGARRPSDA